MTKLIIVLPNAPQKLLDEFKIHMEDPDKELFVVNHDIKIYDLTNAETWTHEQVQKFVEEHNMKYIPKSVMSLQNTKSTGSSVRCLFFGHIFTEYGTGTKFIKAKCSRCNYEKIYYDERVNIEIDPEYRKKYEELTEKIDSIINRLIFSPASFSSFNGIIMDGAVRELQTLQEEWRKC